MLLRERRAGEDWQFRIETSETALHELLSKEDLKDIEQPFAPLECVHSFREALGLLDRYRWYSFYPLEVHPEFLDAVLLEVRKGGGPTEETRWRETLNLHLAPRPDAGKPVLSPGSRLDENESRMPQPTLGKLEKVSLRSLWRHEERDFTPWLSQNIDQLSDLLDIPISVEQTEKRVGSYELDIFGHGPNNAIVIVENQLDATDHTHLGQLLTYAAGLDAAIIVWVAAVVRDEHRSAIEWLNNHTGDEVSFFLVRPEALSISGSLPAVRLTLEAKPSQSTRRLRDATLFANSPWREFLRKFWEGLCPYLVAHGHSWAQGRSATSENFIYSTVGKSGVTVNVTLNKALSRISVSIWLDDSEAAKQQFALLEENKAAIEAEFPGHDLSWDPGDNTVSCGVFVARPYDKDKISEATTEREALYSWIAQNLTTLRKVAKRYLVDGQTV